MINQRRTAYPSHEPVQTTEPPLSHSHATSHGQPTNTGLAGDGRGYATEATPSGGDVIVSTFRRFPNQAWNHIKFLLQP